MSRYYSELLSLLENNHKSFADIQWVGTALVEIRLKEFLEMAHQVPDYDAPHFDYRFSLPSDLLIIGNDFLIRPFPYWEDDWDDTWEYIATPPRPTEIVHLRSLVLPDANHLNKSTIQKLIVHN